ncbi:uncharacterized protein RJT20DRAFT_135122 [Scheffersomyces xylosifermentans]|uniref:uncharacterized protein n=1 Tax=Scheffersomyces xylosifermentans TaxID=1304137 RepID=UPI00315C97D3
MSQTPTFRSSGKEPASDWPSSSDKTPQPQSGSLQKPTRNQTSSPPPPVAPQILSVPQSDESISSPKILENSGNGSEIIQSVTPMRTSQSVSFGDLDGQERARRFTISAQPSVVNVTTQDRAPPVPVSRKTSMTTSSRKNSTNDVLSFLITHGNNPNGSQFAKPSTQSANNSSNNIINNSSVGYSSSANSSRVNSPTAVETSPNALKSSFTFDSSKDNTSFRHKSPSPPPFSRPPAASTLQSSTPTTTVTQSQPIKINSGNNSANVSRRNSMKKSKKTVVASPVGPPVPFQQYLSKEDDGKLHILLACTGSVATIKVPFIIDKLLQIYGTSKISIQLVVTKAAGHFLRGLKIHNDVKIWRDEDEWANYSESYLNTTTTSTTESTTATNANSNYLGVNKKPKNPFDKMILHNELRRWADIMLIAPLSANTLAKISNGIADNLLTSIIRSWGPSTSGQIKKPILVAPAMNTFMYTHPITAKQLLLISSADYGIEVLKPVEKVLVCGDIGMGGMREWSDIVDILRRKISLIKAERTKRDEQLLAEEDEDDEEDDENEEENDEEEDNEEDDEDDDDEDEDEEGEEEDDTNEDLEEGKHKEGDSNTNEETNDNDEMIFDITDQEGEGEQEEQENLEERGITQKINIPKETQNII